MVTGNASGEATSGDAALTRAPGGSETILVVQPEGPIRKLVRRMLARRGYRVLDAPDGEAALEVAGAWSGDIHLLVTSLVLPRLGGRELARRLVAARPELKQLFLSKHPYGSVVDRSLFESGARLLQKPFTPIELLHAVRRALDGDDS